nr:hypothetical protein Iba_chr05bCG10570 [Ipomoea batatas]
MSPRGPNSGRSFHSVSPDNCGVLSLCRLPTKIRSNASSMACKIRALSAPSVTLSSLYTTLSRCCSNTLTLFSISASRTVSHWLSAISGLSGTKRIKVNWTSGDIDMRLP